MSIESSIFHGKEKLLYFFSYNFILKKILTPIKYDIPDYYKKNYVVSPFPSHTHATKMYFTKHIYYIFLIYFLVFLFELLLFFLSCAAFLTKFNPLIKPRPIPFAIAVPASTALSTSSSPASFSCFFG